MTEDGTCQTSPDLTADTPRKKKLKHTIKSKNDQIKKIKKKLNLKRKSNREKTIDQALSQLPPTMANFIRDQINLHSKKSKGRRYSPEMKTIALSLYHASGKAYKILSKLFILPNKSSLKRFISNIPTTSGISEGILKAIQRKVHHMNDMEKICTLCIDEISLKSHLYYSVPDDKIIGLEDFGNGVRSKKIATSALVLLIRSISGNWKQPIGHALVNGSCPTDFLDGLIREAIEKLDAIGLRVLVVMSDMGSNFHSLALRLGITPEKPWFTHNNKVYFLMFDPPHLIKCIRNNLMKYIFKFGNLVASWKDIEVFYNKDKELSIRSAHKLTDKHIHPNNFQKMKVKYATQVLSHTVAASLCTYISLGVLPPSAMGTAELILKFDTLFDSVNSSKLYSPKKLKTPITVTSNHVNFFNEAITFISNLKVFDGNTEVTGRIKCIKGWLITINAIISIWKHLQQNHDFKFLFTRRLNTDPLENFFGTIRQQGGNSDNPTPTQFIRAFRKLLFSSLFTSDTGNCAEDLDALLSQFPSKSNKAVLIRTTQQPQTLVVGETDYQENEVSSSMVQQNAVAYVAGYLLKKCFHVHDCSSCKETLTSKDLESDSLQYCHFKNYKDDTSSSGLILPSQPFLDFVLHLEDMFVQQFSVYNTSTLVGAHLLKRLQSVPVAFKSCQEFPKDYMLKLFLRMRIYYTIKFENRELASPSKRKSKKYIKVTHL